MRSKIKVIFSIVAFSLAAQSQSVGAIADRAPQNRFEEIYQSIVQTVNSASPLSEKLKTIKERDTEYLQLSYQLMDESKTHPEILDRADYVESWELYLKIIPLLQIKVGADKNKADRVSCLEASSLVRPSSGGKVSSQADQKGLGGLGVEDDMTAELLAKLCNK